jgi:hypothetical protein
LQWGTFCEPIDNIIVNNSFFNTGVVTGPVACYYNFFFPLGIFLLKMTSQSICVVCKNI